MLLSLQCKTFIRETLTSDVTHNSGTHSRDSVLYVISINKYRTNKVEILAQRRFRAQYSLNDFTQHLKSPTAVIEVSITSALSQPAARLKSSFMEVTEVI